MIEIESGNGFSRLLADPKFIKTEGKTTTAEIIDDPFHAAFGVLTRAAASGQARFRMDGREVRCAVDLAQVPLLEAGKVAFLRLTLRELG